MHSDNTLMLLLLAIIVAGITSIGIWIILQVFVARRQDRFDEEELREAEERKAEGEARANEEMRRKVVAEAQAAAQKSALDSAAERYQALREDYQHCHTALIEMREASVMLIDVFERLLVRMRPKADSGELYSIDLLLSDVGEARRAINETRRHMR